MNNSTPPERRPLPRILSRHLDKTGGTRAPPALDATSLERLPHSPPHPPSASDVFVLIDQAPGLSSHELRLWRLVAPTLLRPPPPAGNLRPVQHRPSHDLLSVSCVKCVENRHSLPHC